VPRRAARNLALGMVAAVILACAIADTFEEVSPPDRPTGDTLTHDAD